MVGPPHPSGAEVPRPTVTRANGSGTGTSGNSNQFPRTHGGEPIGTDWFELYPMPPAPRSSESPYRPTTEPISRAPAPRTQGQGDGPGATQLASTARGDSWTSSSDHFRNFTGFTIKYYGKTYAPSFKVRPQGRHNDLPVPLGCVLFGTSAKEASKFCCPWRGRGFQQTVRFDRSGVELFHFNYVPDWFGGVRSRRVNVFAPLYYDGRIGHVTLNGKMRERAEIVDCVTNKRYFTRGRVDELSSHLEIVDETGVVAARMGGTWGKGGRNDTCYQISFARHIVTQHTGYVKAIFLTALSLMAMEYRETFLRDSMFALIIGFVFIIIILGVALRFCF